MAHQRTGRARHITAVAALFGVVAFLGWMPAYGDSAQASKLLQQAKVSAAQLKTDSEEMESFTSNRLSWQSHATQINRIREHVNRSGKILAELHEARDGAEPWQQDAIDKITPMLQEMASNTTSIINHLSDNRHTWHPEYTGYLKANAALASDLSRLINDSIDYGKAKSRTESLGKNLGFSESGNSAG